jgi:WD40 repeat protein
MPGSFEQGFPVILWIREDGAADTEIQAVGHLPPAADILEPFINWQLAYRNWQSAYRQTVMSQERIIPRPDRVTNFSWIELGSQLKERLNNWLNSGSSEWRKIRDQLLRNLSETDDEIQVLVQTNDAQLRQFPWNLWDLFSEQYRNAEIALSLLESHPLKDRPLPLTNNVRILAILGDTTNIDVHQDRAILEQLPQAETKFLEEPKRQELNTQLWEQHWDILFFAGHSDSHENGEIGRIYINRNDCLTLDELGNALRTAIERGLKLAIFNSCDGLGLAHRLATWGLPQSIVMREPVPDLVAQEFLKNFLEAFARRRSLYLAVREAREKLQGLEGDFPYASWLPVICQNPAARPLSWSQPLQNSIPGQDRSENTGQTLLPSPIQPATVPDPVSPPTLEEGSDLPPLIAPDEPEPQPPPQPPLYHAIFRYFIILLVGVWIGKIVFDEFVPPKPCDLLATDVSDIDFSSDGKYLATASLDNTVRVLELKGTSFKEVACQSHEDGVVAVKFSPERTKIATASLDSTAGLMEITPNGSISSFKTLQHTNPFPVVALNFSPDGKYLATASADGKVHLWDTNSRNEIAVLKHKTYVRAVSFSRDGKYLATASLNNKAQVWEWQAHKYDQKAISLPPEDVVDVIFSPTNNNYLTTASADGTTQVWEITSSPKAIAHLDLNTYIMNVSFSPDGKYVATTSSDNKARVWDWQTHSNDQKAISLPQDNVVAVAFSPTNGKYIAAASTDGTVEVWTTNGGSVRTFLNKGDPDKNSLVGIAFSPTDDNYLATASADGTVEIRNENSPNN